MKHKRISLKESIQKAIEKHSTKQEFYIITDKPNEKGDCTFERNGRAMVRMAGTEFDIGKLVYAQFNEDGQNNLDPLDPSWPVDHIDGDYTNNYIKNLAYIEVTDNKE